MGDAVIGTVTAHLYSAAHPSPKNKDFVAAFEKANNFRPNFMAVGGYDGMHLIYEALKKTGGNTNGDKLIAAMKGMAWESPRGPISIDADTRDIIQNIYIRKVEKVDGKLYNVEFETFEDVKDPGKAAEVSGSTATYRAPCSRRLPGGGVGIGMPAATLERSPAALAGATLGRKANGLDSC